MGSLRDLPAGRWHRRAAASSLGKSRGPRALVGSALWGSSAGLGAPQVPDPQRVGAGEGWELAFATLLPKIPWLEPCSVAPRAVTGAGAYAQRAALGFWDFPEKPAAVWGEKKGFLSKEGKCRAVGRARGGWAGALRTPSPPAHRSQMPRVPAAGTALEHAGALSEEPEPFPAPGGSAASPSFFPQSSTDTNQPVGMLGPSPRATAGCFSACCPPSRTR